MLLTALVFLLILTILVMIHELGHYLMAKRFGIKVEEFGFGLPPRAWGKKIGETIYSINWLPIGGFVKLYGEDESGGGRVRTKNHTPITNNLQRAFFTRPVSQRAIVVGAGVIMNAALAVIIFYIFLLISNFKTEIPLLENHKFFGVEQTNSSDIVITSVAKNSPAERIGLTRYSRISAVNDKQIANVEEFVSIVNKNKGKEVKLIWKDEKTGRIAKALIIPRVSPPANEGALGIAFFPLSTAILEYKTPTQKAFSGFTHPTNLLIYNFKVMSKLIGISVQKKSAAPIGEGVSGPVGIVSIVNDIGKIPNITLRILGYLNLAGILSISLAFFNVLPIPALDGGRLFFIIYEGITGRKVNQRFESVAHTIGMMILLFLIALITFKDLLAVFR